MTPEQILEYIDRGREMIARSIDPVASMTKATEENITFPGDTQADMQGHYLNTGLTIIKSAIDQHIKETRRDRVNV